MFITLKDLHGRINPTILDQITGGDTELIDDAEASASAIITDALEQVYELEAEWQAVGGERNRRLVLWMLSLMGYFLYASVPDDAIPERIVKDYDDTRAELQKVEDGKLAVNLPRKTAEDGTKRTKFRWGSNPIRQHTI